MIDRESSGLRRAALRRTTTGNFVGLAALVVLTATATTIAVPVAPVVPAEPATHADPEALSGRVYAVLPFENIAEDASLTWLSSGLALAIGESARGWGARVMDPDERDVFLEANGLPAGATLTLASMIDLGRKMRHRPANVRPDRIVLGRFDVIEGRILIEARTLDLVAERARPWIKRSGRLRDLLSLQRDLAVAIATDEKVRVAATDPWNDRQIATLPLLAFETYCRAMTEPDTRRRLLLLRRASEEHPGYGAALFQAAALLAREERWSEAGALLAQAKEPPHPYETEALILSAGIALQRRDYDGAAAAARRALQNGGPARAHLVLARALAGLGDEAGAAAALDQARSADPTDPEIEEVRRALGDRPTSPTRRSP